MYKSTSWFANNGVVLRRVVAGLLLGALRMTECLRLSSRNQLGNWVYGELCTLQPDSS